MRAISVSLCAFLSSEFEGLMCAEEARAEIEAKIEKEAQKQAQRT